MLKKYLFTFLFLLLATININSQDSTQVKNYVRAEATGSSAKVETNIQTNVNQSETTIKTNQPGTISVETKNGETEIKISKNITPTIIIKNNAISPEVKVENFDQAENIQPNADKKFIQNIFIQLKSFFLSLKRNLFFR